MSQATLASESGVSPSEVSKIESGQVDPAWGTVRQLAEPLGTSVETLAQLEEEIERGSVE